MRRVLYMALLSTLVAATASAGQLNVSASKRVVAVGEIFHIEVEAIGSEIATPYIADSQDFEIERNSPSTSTSRRIEIANGRVVSTVTSSWRYRASALRKGTFVLPVITVEIDGQVETAPEIMITVQDTPTLRQSAPRQENSGAAQNRNAPSRSGEPRKQLTVDDIVYIDSFVDKTEVYQGERLLLTWQFWLLDEPHIGSSKPEGRPSVEGFYEGEVTSARYAETRDGYDYMVYEWRQPLYATGSGDYAIGPWQWNGIVKYPDSGFISELRKSYRTSHIEVKVRPLPPRPDGFTGAVGTFTLRSSLLDNVVTQGVPTTLIVRVAGEGNPDAIGAPVMPELAWGHVSDAETEYKGAEDDSTSAVEKSFIYRITPRESGTLTIPPIQFVYFSPEQEDYVTLKTESRAVYVEPSEEDGELVVIGDTVPREEKNVRILGEDVLAIVKESDALTARGSRIPLNLGLLLSPPLAYVGLFLWRRKKGRLEADSEYARRHFARSVATRRLRALKTASDPVAEMHGAVTQYLADVLGAARAGFTSHDADRLLSERGAPEDVRATFVKVIRACERGRYGGAELSTVEVDALRHAVLSAMDAVERIAPKEGR